MRAFTVFEATLALADEVRAADQTHAERTSLFLRATDGTEEGWSEFPAASRAGVDPTADEVIAGIVELLAAPTWRSSGSAAATAPTRGRRAIDAARSMLDAAVLDLGLRHEGQSLKDAIGIADVSVGFAGVVGIADPELAAARATALVALGASRLRVKVAPEEGLASLRAVLAAVAVPVVADANGSFAADDDELAVLLELPLAWLEQPFAPGDWAQVATLAREVDVPIGLDESVTSLAELRAIGRAGAAQVVCIKPSRFGIRGAIEARRVAAELGMRSYVGGYFEAGLGRAVLAAIAAVRSDLDGDVVAPSTYLTVDPCALAGPRDGRQPLHVTPGCGPAPNVAGMRVRLERVAEEPTMPSS